MSDVQLVDLLNADIPALGELLDAHPAVFLTGEAEARLRKWADMANTEDRRATLSWHAALLADARALGVTGGFRLLALEEALAFLSRPTDWTKFRGFVERRPDIALSEDLAASVAVVRAWVTTALDAAPALDREAWEGIAATLTTHAACLDECRADGVAAALARRGAWEDGARENGAGEPVLPPDFHILRDGGGRDGGGVGRFTEPPDGADALVRRMSSRLDQRQGVVWAAVQGHLGAASARLGAMRGDPEPVEAAVTAFRAALMEYPRARAARPWAMTQTALGNALVRLGTMRGDADMLNAAADAFRAALTEHRQDRAPMAWATTQNNLGNAFLRLGEVRGDVEALTEAVAAYRAALTERTRERAPLDWAGTLTNFATASMRLGELSGEVAALETAINAYRESLVERTRERAPMDWAMTQNSLGNAYLCVVEVNGDAGALESAISAYRAALMEYRQDRAPTRWAMVQNNLGNALGRLGTIRGDAGALDMAVAAYRDALTEYTRERSPMDWAGTQTDLGNALLELGKMRRDIGTLEAAITAFHEALRERLRERAPLQWALTQINLGNAAALIGELRGDAASLETALAAYHDALTEYTRERTPMDWAGTQTNLGNALFRLAELRGDLGALEAAIAAHRAALAVFTRAWAPVDWAMAQFNLGSALERLGAARDDQDVLKLAVAAYREALTEHSLARAPLNCLTTAGALARLALRLGDWETVEDILAPLLESAIPMIQVEGARERQSLFAHTLGGLGDALAYSRLRRGDGAGAVMAAGRGRAIVLDSALMLDAVEKRAELLEARAVWRAAQAAAALTDAPPDGGDAEALARHARRRVERHAAVGNAFERFRDRMAAAGLVGPSTPDLTGIARAAPPGGALVAVVVTAVGGAALILRHGRSEPQSLLLDALTTDALSELLGRGGEEAAGVRAKGAGSLRAVLAALGAMMMEPLGHHLRDLGLKPDAEVALMAPGRLSVLPLHAAASGAGRVFLDDWTVSYTPSLGAFVASHARAARRAVLSPRLLAVTDPEGNLPIDRNPAWDAFALADRLALSREQATRRSVLDALPTRTHVSFYGHGSWKPDQPDRSGLHMADGFLTMTDLRDVDLSMSRLAVLAACQSGLVDIDQQADEFVGLPAALIEAGVPAVVASQWVVGAAATERLMRLFFQRHLAGASPAVALRDAQREMRGLAQKPRVGPAPSPTMASHARSGMMLGIGSTADVPDHAGDPLDWAGFAVTGA